MAVAAVVVVVDRLVTDASRITLTVFSRSKKDTCLNFQNSDSPKSDVFYDPSCHGTKITFCV